MLGVAAALYGFALALRRPVAGGAMLGCGVARRVPLARVPGTRVARSRRRSRCRSRSTAGARAATRSPLVVALAVAVPLGGAWPLALSARAPAHLHAWWAMQSVSDYFAPLAAARPAIRPFLLKNLPWFAWPALPLVLWTLWTRGRGFNGGLATPAVQLPGTLALVMAVVDAWRWPSRARSC